MLETRPAQAPAIAESRTLERCDIQGRHNTPITCVYRIWRYGALVRDSSKRPTRRANRFPALTHLNSSTPPHLRLSVEAR